MLFVHGFGEHSGRYEGIARWFAERGRSVHAYDQMGHGLSSGARGHVTRFDDYLDDLEFMLNRISAGDSHPLPILIGHSLGGLIAATLIGSLAQAFVRMALVCMQFALLILVVWAGVIAWRHYNASSNNGRLSGAALTAEEPGGDLPLRTSEGPQERRQRLEEELFQLDAESGHAWWDVDAAPASDP